MLATSVRERLTRLGAPPRPRPQPVYELPRGFEECTTPFGVAAVRQDVIPLPHLDPPPATPRPPPGQRRVCRHGNHRTFRWRRDLRLRSCCRTTDRLRTTCRAILF